MWQIDRSKEIIEWILTVDDDAKEAILKNLMILKKEGPALGRPYVDTLKASKHKNLKELRVQCKKQVIRILFIFDPERKALLLVGGDKRGDKNFYKKMIPKADAIYDRYLKEEKWDE